VVNGQAEAFLIAKEALRVGDSGRLARVTPQIKGYPLEPYLEFWQLRYRLEDRSTEEIRAFLDRHEGSLLAEQLRSDWVKILGRKGQWDLFAAERARLLNEDADVACYGLAARWQGTEAPAMAEELKPLWLAPRDLPHGCDWVARQLLDAGVYGSEHVWQRFRLLADTGRVRQAKKVLESLPQGEAPAGRAVDQAFGSPLKYLQAPLKPLTDRAARELVMVAFTQLGRNDLASAGRRFNEALRVGPVRESFSAEERAYVWGQLATAAARRHMPEALEWFAAADDTVLSDDQLAWRVRSALRAGSWIQVRAAIERMTPRGRAEPAWVYWDARALKALGHPEQADAQFALLAGETHYYGRLAAEELGLPFELPPKAPASTQQELDEAAAVPGLRRALALFALGMRGEAVREWNWALRGMDDRQLLAAAELARSNEIWDRAISTADRTFSLHDFSLRYPAPHRDVFLRQARARELDVSWVLGLVRQESRFIAAARSSAGAAGLMQLMPATARWVARKLGLKEFTPAKITTIDLNAAMGTYYLRTVLDDLDGQPVLAAAAYNAGPGRARAWLDASPMEGAVYVESIPFGETRDYVKKVMTNTLYYAAVLGGAPWSLKQKLGHVGRRSTIASIDTP
jgi:soluble lytic murein transglycosylase